jgi:amidase
MASVPPIADWQALAKSKRESVFAKIPKDWLLPTSQTSQYTESSSISVLDVPRTCGILTDKELDLTENYDATDLVKMMAEKQVKSVEVVTAFCKRAAVAQQCVNCLTEIMFDEAIARARECDEYLEKNGKVLGPLHGLPISLKVRISHNSQAFLSMSSSMFRVQSDHNTYMQLVFTKIITIGLV